MKRSASVWLWPIAILVSSTAIAYVSFYDISSNMRPLLAFWFLLVCPGMAFVPLLRLRDWVMELSLGIVLSITLTGLVSGIMLYLRVWSPLWGVAVLVMLSVVGAILQIVTSYFRTDSGASAYVDKQTA